MRTSPKPFCVACGSPGRYLYQDMPDRLFGVAGLWQIKVCSGADCDTLWLDPAPLEEDLPMAYEDYYTHAPQALKEASFFDKVTAGYLAKTYQYEAVGIKLVHKLIGSMFGSITFFKEHMDYPFVYFKDIYKGKFLELGVGSGSTLSLFSRWGWHAEGLDFDPQAVGNAISKGLTVHQGDIFSQKFKDNSFDAIFSSHVLEHVPDPLAVLKKSFDILKSEGIFVAVTPNKKSRLHCFFKHNWLPLDPPRHLYIFSPNSLESLARQAGFRSIEIKSSNYSAAGVFVLSYKISKFGKADLGDRSAIRYFAQIVRFVLNAMFWFSPLSGEELILIAYK